MSTDATFPASESTQAREGCMLGETPRWVGEYISRRDKEEMRWLQDADGGEGGDDERWNTQLRKGSGN